MPGSNIRGPRAKGASSKEIVPVMTDGLTHTQVVALRDLLEEVLADESIGSSELRVYLHALTETVLRGKTENQTHASVIAKKINRNTDTTQKALRSLRKMKRLGWKPGDLLEWGLISLPPSVAKAFAANEGVDASSSRCALCGAPVGDHFITQNGGPVCDDCFEPF
jgi:hypothetical protein